MVKRERVRRYDREGEGSTGPRRKVRHAPKRGGRSGGTLGTGTQGGGDGRRQECAGWSVHSGPLQPQAGLLQQVREKTPAHHTPHLPAPSLCQRNHILPKDGGRLRTQVSLVEGTPCHLRGNALLFSHFIQSPGSHGLNPAAQSPASGLKWGPALQLQREKGEEGRDGE